MPYIQWIDEAEATGAVKEGYDFYFQKRPNRTKVADIVKCFSHRPDFMVQMMEFSWSLHFADGHLPERTKEMLATLVSGQNRCPYCMHSHAYFLHQHGAADTVVAAIGKGEVATAEVSDAERELLKFAEKVTNESYRVTAADVQILRDVGWTEPQIAEAAYITALFGFFNRVANTFGLRDPQYFAQDGKADPLEGLYSQVEDAPVRE